MAIVHWEYIRRNYKAPILSVAFLMQIVFYCAVIIGSFCMAYFSRSIVPSRIKYWIIYSCSDLYTKHNTYWEQPIVSIRPELIFFGVGELDSGYISWSTEPSYNSLLQESARTPFLKVTSNIVTY
jgi:hypothetical protein